MHKQTHTQNSTQALLFPMQNNPEIKVNDVVMINDKSHSEWSFYAVIKQVLSNNTYILNNGLKRQFKADGSQFYKVRHGAKI